MATVPENAYDVIVIGGGASGLAAAVTAARQGCRVAILERDAEAGLSILATGNGRCNISNSHLDPARYLHPEAARAIMGPGPEDALERFFASVGIMTAAEGDRLYPYSKRAASVRDALLGAAARCGVEVVAGSHIERVEHLDPGGAQGFWSLVITCPSGPLHAKRKGDAHADLRALRRALAAAPRTRRTIGAPALIIACGGSSAQVAGVFGLPHIDESPVLRPVSCTPVVGTIDTDAWDGIRADAAVSLFTGDSADPIWSERGEVLFRRWGISGIVAFDLSRRARPGDRVEVDLFPAFDVNALANRFARRAHEVGRAVARDPRWFDGLLARELAGAVLASAEEDGDEISPSRLAHAAKHLVFEVRDLAQEQSAQVRRGGIPLDAVDLATLEIADPAHRGLFACGEALDQDADCGGFNLAWAWLTGIRAGDSAARGRRLVPQAPSV